MTKHTPGPWRVLGSAVADNALYFAIGIDGDDRVDDGSQIIAKAYGRSDWEHEYPSRANANLIAAAPDLLALLKECRQQVRLLHPELRDRIDFVIAKAES